MPPYLPTGRTPGSPPPDFDIILCDTKVDNEMQQLTFWFDFTEGKNLPTEETPFSLTYTLTLTPKEPGNGSTFVLSTNKEINNIVDPKAGVFAQLPITIEDQSPWKLVAAFSRLERNGESFDLELWDNNVAEGDLLQEQDEEPVT